MTALKKKTDRDVESDLIGKISAERIRATAEKFARISMRVTGSDNERLTAEGISDEFAKLDLNPAVEEYETTSWEHGPAEFTLADGTDRKFDVHFMPFSPPVPKNGARGKVILLKFGFPKEMSAIGNEPCIPIIDWNQDAGVHYQVLSAARSGKKIAALGLIGPVSKAFRIDAIPILAKPVGFPVFSIVKEDGLALRTMCANGRFSGRLDGKSKIIEGAKSANVVARVKGAVEPEHRIIISAHHDGWFAGANDNLSSVGCIIETARLLGEVEPRRGVEFISFGSEESGSSGFQYYLWGSRNYVKKHSKELSGISTVLNSELAGHTNTEHLLVDCTPDLVSFFEVIFDDLNKLPSYSNKKVSLSAAVPTSSQADQVNFSLAGVPSSLIYWAWYDEYHTDLDRPELLSVERLRMFEELLLISAIRSADSPVLPLSLTRYARILRTGHSVISSHLSIELGRVSTPGLETLKRLTGNVLDLNGAMGALDELSKSVGAFERYLLTAEDADLPKDNSKLLATCSSLNAALCRTGGILGEDAMFPGFLQYAEELRKVNEAVEALQRVKGSDMSSEIKSDMVPLGTPEVETRMFDISECLELISAKRDSLRQSLQKEVDRVTTAIEEAGKLLRN